MKTMIFSDKLSHINAYKISFITLIIPHPLFHINHLSAIYSGNTKEPLLSDDIPDNKKAPYGAM